MTTPQYVGKEGFIKRFMKWVYQLKVPRNISRVGYKNVKDFSNSFLKLTIKVYRG